MANSYRHHGRAGSPCIRATPAGTNADRPGKWRDGVFNDADLELDGGLRSQPLLGDHVHPSG